MQMKNSVIIQNETSEDLKEILSGEVETKFKTIPFLLKEISDYYTRLKALIVLRIGFRTFHDLGKRRYFRRHLINSQNLCPGGAVYEHHKVIQSIRYWRA